MSMQTDVKAKTVSATGQLAIGPARIKGIYFSATTGGTLDITCSVNNNPIQLVLPIGTNYLLLPGEGVRMSSDPLVTFTTLVGSVTLFYG